MQQPYCPDLAQRSLDSHRFLKVQQGTSLLPTLTDLRRLTPCPLCLCRWGSAFCHHVTLRIPFYCVVGSLTRISQKKMTTSCYILKTPPLNGMKTSVSKPLKEEDGSRGWGGVGGCSPSGLCSVCNEAEVLEPVWCILHSSCHLLRSPLSSSSHSAESRTRLDSRMCPWRRGNKTMQHKTDSVREAASHYLLTCKKTPNRTGDGKGFCCLDRTLYYNKRLWIYFQGQTSTGFIFLKVTNHFSVSVKQTILAFIMQFGHSSTYHSMSVLDY